MYKKLFKTKKVIRLDLGAGGSRQDGFITLDARKLPNVDIVWDVTKFPYPIPSNVCGFVLMSHLWEHIEPKYRIDVLDEIWRITKVGGQLAIASPYSTSFGAAQDPTHYPCPNEATFTYFDPGYPMYKIYKPKPWKIIRNDYALDGNLEVLLEKK